MCQSGNKTLDHSVLKDETTGLVHQNGSGAKFSLGRQAEGPSLKCKRAEGRGQMLLTAVYAPQQTSVLFSSPGSEAERRNNWWLRFGKAAGDCRGSSLITCFFGTLQIQSEVQQGILSSRF